MRYRRKSGGNTTRIRTRMVQLGHLDAKGALNYVDKSKIEPFAFDHEAWSDSDHTFIIDRNLFITRRSFGGVFFWLYGRTVPRSMLYL